MPSGKTEVNNNCKGSGHEITADIANCLPGWPDDIPINQSR